jgi:beta-lactamase regulating signal transducer with metallopeptidase domain
VRDVFLEILDMSLMASFVVCAVILTRLILKKAPRVFSYALCTVVFFRFLCPFELESAVGFLPASVDDVPQIIISARQELDPPPNFTQTINAADVETVPAASTVTQTAGSVNFADKALDDGVWIWVIGMGILFSYALFGCIRLNIRLRTAALVRDNIYETDRFTMPFVLGLINPKIYLPVGIENAGYIIEHEQTHINRRDYIARPIAFFALCLHWFNPVAWLSFFLFCKDMEASCDSTL